MVYPLGFQEPLLKDTIWLCFCRITLHDSLLSATKKHVDYLSLVTSSGSKWADYVPSADSLHFLLLWAGQCMKSCLRDGFAQLANSMGWKNMCKGEEVEFLCGGQRSKRAWRGCKSAEYFGHLLNGMKKRDVRFGY